MTQQAITQQARAGLAGSDGARAWEGAAPEIAVRFVGALLTLAVATVHVADQGGADGGRFSHQET